MNHKFFLLVAAVLLLGCTGAPSDPIRSSAGSPSISVTPSIAAIASASGNEPTAEQVLTEAESEDSSIALNTLAYRALAESGIDNALVDVTEERALAGFPLPPEIAKEDAVAYAFGVMAAFHPTAKLLVVQIMDPNGKAVEQFESTPSTVEAESDSGTLVKKSRVPV